MTNSVTLCAKCMHPMHWRECPDCSTATNVCRNDQSEYVGRVEVAAPSPAPGDVREVTTAAGKRLHDRLRNHDLDFDRSIAAIEAEAAAADRARLREAVEGLIEQAGGRCVAPPDMEGDNLDICERHSELWFADDDGCEDQPRQLLRVLALLDPEPREGGG